MSNWPHASASFRKLRRNIRLVVADFLLQWAETAIPDDMDEVKVSVLRAELTVLDAMDFSTTKRSMQ